ncbi:transmembrane protein [Cyclospora cayetanensis]|uniref:Transmembrane protein n=1 Tax=Cyclospora cayetanensis TaxID=88456 RepID=A0A1D3D688_9EIME|nr:transmembrane protein [Cyclospora cayetanensis]
MLIAALFQVVEDVVAVLMELFALHYILVSKKALSYAAETRLICVGLGWALGHVFFTNGHYILKAFFSKYFRWDCLYLSLHASVAPIIYLSVASLIFLSTRRHRPLHSRVTYLAFAALLVPWTLTLRQGLGLSSRASQFLFEEISGFCWLALLIRLCIAVCAGVSTYLIIRDRPGTPGKGSKGGAFFRKVE